jgi:hypothetical protein
LQGGCWVCCWLLASWANRLQFDKPMTTRRQPFRNQSETLWQTVGSQLVTITNPLAACGQPVDKPSAAWQPIGNVLAATRWQPVRNTLCTPFGDTKEPPGTLKDPPSTRKDSRIHQGPRDQPGSGGGGRAQGRAGGDGWVRRGSRREKVVRGRTAGGGRDMSTSHAYAQRPELPAQGDPSAPRTSRRTPPPSHPHATQDIQSNVSLI